MGEGGFGATRKGESEPLVLYGGVILTRAKKERTSPDKVNVIFFITTLFTVVLTFLPVT